MPRFNGRCYLALALLLGSLAAFGLHCQARRGPLPLDDWDIPQLVAHLEQRGLRLHTVPVQKDNSLTSAAYLTTTEQDWLHYNRLFKEPSRIEQWQGTLYCELHGVSRDADLDRLYGDCYLVAGPFFFFGDRGLLEKVRIALFPSSHLAPSSPS